MAFDPEIHQIKVIIIKCGQLLHPEEKDLTKLYKETSVLLGMPEIKTSTADANHLPTPEESARQNPNSMWVAICPACGKKSYVLHPLCSTCKESEGGKYKSMFLCFECQHKEKFEKYSVQVATERGMRILTGTKRNLGIKTITDEGLK